MPLSSVFWYCIEVQYSHHQIQLILSTAQAPSPDASVDGNDMILQKPQRTLSSFDHYTLQHQNSIFKLKISFLPRLTRVQWLIMVSISRWYWLIISIISRGMYSRSILIHIYVHNNFVKLTLSQVWFDSKMILVIFKIHLYDEFLQKIVDVFILCIYQSLTIG